MSSSAAHNRFRERSFAEFSSGGASVLDAIGDYINGNERRPLALHGESGSGKIRGYREGIR